MMRLVGLCVVVLGVVGCAPVITYHKADVPLTKFRDDQVSCQVDALRDAPVAMRTQQDPPRYVPPRRVCTTSDRCYTEPGYWLPGPIRSVDVNADLRAELQGRCMIGRGYDRVSLPRCPAGLETQLAASHLPPLSDQSCVRRDGPLQTILTQP